ncbi:hypothetical protein PPL_00435 [Heterostelium album PN500]|uniref:MD-2-related lipid-recognition domain-containing protein n=1 Tax=Heterostelium pallidum (strain ATCC 26659 / Pp 5 / PN500) TaxID=670386 RepID=D3AWG1_HETP5|nr:hypothetical protein PPL_00435 [Heterostelium album PN500]EFA86634.1 hypothetical protein PPL_00435 [Heterostelium album PN500]|eukprot:XP_020438739.1 hypothetical protein PPL_00435 [Heterostelium album PN500]
MDRLNIILVLGLLFVAVNGDIWQQCEGNVNPTFSITSLTLQPDPPVIGKSVVVNAVGTLSEQVTSGNSVFTIQFYIAGAWRNLPTFKNDVCSVVKCPVAQGPFSFSTTIPIPFITPRGQYRGQFIVTDQSNRNITCLTFATQLN